MKTLFSYSQQFSLPKVRKTRLQADFVTNNQIIPTHRLLDFINFSDPPPPDPTPHLLRPSYLLGT